jgi:hypothetical protein
MSKDPITEFVDFHLWLSSYANAQPVEAQIFAEMLRERGLAAIDSMLQELSDAPEESEVSQ